MKITAVNMSNTQSKSSFKGGIDKSFVKYLNECQKDIIKQNGKKDVYGYNPEIVTEAQTKIEAIIKRLTSFFLDTKPDTKLVLEKGDEEGRRFPIIINKKMKTRIRGWAAPCVDENLPPATPEGVNISLPIPPKARKFLAINSFWYKQKHDIDDINILDKWSRELVEKVKPSDIDKAIQEKADTYKHPNVLWKTF